MPENIQKKRCAIYTRKSVEDEVMKSFNSNDAQRESGEAYIVSQKGNGWICLPERYDDYGFSGGNMNRPALKRLLAAAEAGLVDIILVYKIDRLSRSITDFAELSAKFDKWGVSFVAVTQDINTSTSSGRMMLNILMTFAQYEREIIAERVRDKMSATRKKGKWVGGTVPMGYRVVEKKLIEETADAEIVRRVFRRFIEIQSPKQIAAELNQAGSKTKQGKEWTTGYIYRMLNNHTYVGEVNYHGEVCKGEHKGLVERGTWDRVREIMNDQKPVKEPKGKVEVVAPLKGILRCGHCDCAMMPTYGQKGARKFFYYLCGKDTKRGTSICPVHRIPAGDIEEILTSELLTILKTPELVAQAAEKAGIAPAEVQGLFGEGFTEHMTPGERNRLFALLIERAVIFKDHLEIEYKSNGMKSLIEELQNA